MLLVEHALLAVSVYASVLSWNDASSLGLALFFDVSGHHTGKTFNFFKPCDTFEFVLQVRLVRDDKDVSILNHISDNLKELIISRFVFTEFLSLATSLQVKRSARSILIFSPSLKEL